MTWDSSGEGFLPTVYLHQLNTCHCMGIFTKVYIRGVSHCPTLSVLSLLLCPFFALQISDIYWTEIEDLIPHRT